MIKRGGLSSIYKHKHCHSNYQQQKQPSITPNKDNLRSKQMNHNEKRNTNIKCIQKDKQFKKCITPSKSKIGNENNINNHKNDSNMHNKTYTKLSYHDSQLQELQTLRIQNKQLKNSLGKLYTQNNDRIYSYQQYIQDLKQNIIKLQTKLSSYEDSIKFTIMWILQAYITLNKSIKFNRNKQLDNFKTYFYKAFKHLSQYLQELDIENKLKSLQLDNQQQSQQIKDMSMQMEMQMIKFQTIQNSFQDTFNLEKNMAFKQVNINPSLNCTHSQINETAQYENIDNMTFEANNNCIMNIKEQYVYPSNKQKNEQSSTIDCYQAQIITSYNSPNENYITLIKGQNLTLLRKVGQDLWIGQIGDKIGYVNAKFIRIKNQ